MVTAKEKSSLVFYTPSPYPLMRKVKRKANILVQIPK